MIDVQIYIYIYIYIYILYIYLYVYMPLGRVYTLQDFHKLSNILLNVTCSDKL